MFADAARAVIRDSLFDGGQFALVLDVTETALIERTTVTRGGGAIVGGPDVVIRNSTLSGNTESGLTVRAGAAVRVESSTLVDNFWFGILAGANSSVTVGASVLAQYEHTCERVTPGDPTAQFVSAGYNLVSDATCGFAATGDAVVADPALGPVADNGGATPTNRPDVGSPVIDAIPVGTAGLCDGTIATDQRGFPRPLGAACDIGAVEVSDEIVVDTAADGVDVDPGDGVCDDGTGACTLRAAVTEANVLSGGEDELITIAPGVNPVLAPLGPVTIAGGIVIDGGGSTVTGAIPSAVFVVEHLDTTFRDLTVDATGSYVAIAGSGSDPGRSVTLDGVSIGFAESIPSNSGVYFQGAALTVVDSEISAPGGRAVDVAVVDLVIERSNVEAKDAVVNESPVSERVVIRDSTVRGGDLDLYLIDIGESVLIERSTILGSYYGASVGAPQVVVRASTFTGASGGPGLYGSTSLEVTASTFAGIGYAGVFLAAERSPCGARWSPARSPRAPASSPPRPPTSPGGTTRRRTRRAGSPGRGTPRVWCRRSSPWPTTVGPPRRGGRRQARRSSMPSRSARPGCATARPPRSTSGASPDRRAPAATSVPSRSGRRPDVGTRPAGSSPGRPPASAVGVGRTSRPVVVAGRPHTPLLATPCRSCASSLGCRRRRRSSGEGWYVRLVEVGTRSRPWSVRCRWGWRGWRRVRR